MFLGPPVGWIDSAELSQTRPGQPVCYQASRVGQKTGRLGNKSADWPFHPPGRTGRPFGSVNQAWSNSNRAGFKTLQWITTVLKMNGLWDFVNTKIYIPSNISLVVDHNMKDVKGMGIILDGVRDHIIPHIIGKGTTRKPVFIRVKMRIE